MTAQEYRTPDSVGRLQRNALVAGGIGLLLCIVAAMKAPQIFFPSYLMGYMLVLGLALGSLGLLMLQHLTGGHWGIVIRRPLESATRTLPLLAILFLPIVFGMKYLYGAWLNLLKECRRAAIRFAAELSDLSRILSARSDLFCGVDRVDAYFQQLVAPAGRQPGGSLLAPPLQDARRSRHHSVCLRHDLRRHRLGDVHFSALGFHDLRLPVCRGPAYFVHVADDRGSGSAFAHRAHGRADSKASPSRPGQIAASLS